MPAATALVAFLTPELRRVQARGIERSPAATEDGRCYHCCRAAPRAGHCRSGRWPASSGAPRTRRRRVPRAFPEFGARPAAADGGRHQPGHRHRHVQRHLRVADAAPLANLRLGMLLEIFTTVGAALPASSSTASRIDPPVDIWRDDGAHCGRDAQPARSAQRHQGPVHRRRRVRRPVSRGRGGGEVAYRMRRVPIACLFSRSQGSCPISPDWRRRAEGAGTQRLVRRAAPRVGGHERSDDRRYGDGRLDQLLRSTATCRTRLRRARCSGCWPVAVGLRIADRSRAEHLKCLLAAILAAVAVIYFIKALL